MESLPLETVVTLWFVTVDQPEKVVAASYRADRGFGRKLLAQLHPTAPVALIGQFSLNHSAPASRGEYYIAGFPGLSIIQTVVTGLSSLSTLNPVLLNSIPAADVYAFATDEATGFGAFAHWQGPTLKRSFAATPTRVFDDTGLVEAFESPFWSGTNAPLPERISLPFAPIELAQTAEKAWLGFDPTTAPNINVVAYAIDGRPEPKVADTPVREPRKSPRDRLDTAAATKPYDDYEGVHDYEQVISPVDYAETAAAAARKTLKRTKKTVSTLATKLNAARAEFHDRIRHADRLDPPKIIRQRRSNNTKDSSDDTDNDA